jgi:hypothetical protein
MELYYASIAIAIGDEKNAKFWHSLWFDGLELKDITHSILDISKEKRRWTRHSSWILDYGVLHPLEQAPRGSNNRGNY